MAEAKDRLFYVRSRMCGHALDIAAMCQDDGAKCQIWGKKEGEADECKNQLWYEDQATGTLRTFLNHNALDFDGDSIVVNPVEEGKSDQRWMVAGDKIENRDDHQRVVDIKAQCGDEGTELCAWEHSGQKNQQFYFEYIPVRYFKIVSVLNPENALDLDGANCGEDAHVHLWRDNGQENQMWFQGPDGLIRSKLSGYVLDASGETVVLNPYNPGNQMQGFTLSGTDNKIVNMNDGQVLDIEANNPDKGSNLVAWEYKEEDNQHWTIEYI